MFVTGRETQPAGLPLQNPVARDLWWLVFSPPLLRDVERFPQHSISDVRALQQGVEEVVRTLDAMDLDEACAAVGVPGWRVGFYFEALVAFWIAHLRGWHVLGTNVPVRRERDTLGAFDFILRNPLGEVEHWEVAVKFYLLLGDRETWRCWVGPNQRDRLDKKVNRMRDHQLTLSARVEGRAAWSGLGVKEIQRRYGLLKGSFFTEWGGPDEGPPHSVSVARGRWADVERLDALHDAYSESLWVKREKPFWLAPARIESGSPGGLPDDVGRPEMWSRLTQGDDRAWEEAERWFLVPRSWRLGKSQ